ncbi:YcaO-like family protein [Streptomyces sp. LHD-70]|uniref:YcaO-like family protein n=1 Tax=Streptomyces sp. LHD-70 TaxID=3072140 RepID=UPI00280EAE9B|nr:YcaO-like family protein [Streptomyces sp. LHD-70]MDQ8706932.1 YcaO-like family protein [Streptomyces sp. LHD-70]
MKKVHFDGTHRVRRPEETWAAVDARREAFGITRVADVTGLDTLGVPVAVVVRPAARSLTVSPGQGTSPLLARISAVMAALERWHAEYACPPAELRNVPAGDLELPYAVGELAVAEGRLLGERTPLDWVLAAEVAGGSPALVPRACVALDEEATGAWQPPLLHASTDGLAGGNSYDEAVAHALYEVIERDCTASAAAVPRSRRVYVDPASVDDPHCADLLRRIADGGARAEIVSVPNRWGLPCFACSISPAGLPANGFPSHTADSPRPANGFPAAPAVGSGVHSSPGIALGRAVAKAAQNRLTALVGSRDDLPAVRSGPAPGPTPGAVVGPWAPGRTVAWHEVGGPGREFAEDTQETRWLADRLRAVTGRPPLVVDLSTEGGFSVVKVVAPGLGGGSRHGNPPRREPPGPAVREAA